MKKVTLQGFNRAERRFVISILSGQRPRGLYQPTFHNSRVQPRTRTGEYVFRRMIRNGLLQDLYGKVRVTTYGKLLGAALVSL